MQDCAHIAFGVNAEYLAPYDFAFITVTKQ